MKQIPLIYLDVIERFYRERNLKDQLEIDVARRILGIHYHIPREKRFGVLNEMDRWGLIKLTGSRFLLIIWTPDNLD